MKTFNLRVIFRRTSPYIKIKAGWGNLDSPLRGRVTGKKIRVNIYDQDLNLLKSSIWIEGGKEFRKLQATGHISLIRKGGEVDLVARNWDSWEKDDKGELSLGITVYDPAADHRSVSQIVQTYNSWESMYDQSTSLEYQDDEILIYDINEKI